MKISFQRFSLNLLLASSIIFLCATCKKDTSQPNLITPKNTIVKTDIESWLTLPDKSATLTKQNVAINFSNNTNSDPTIEIDETQTYQSMDGFGYTLTGGSAYLLNQKLNTLQRSTLLKELFLPDTNGIGVNYLRISIGASDLDATVFSYDDLATGQTDPLMQKFSIAPDKVNLIPVLKEIIALNPTIKILGSPWSPPTWMKTNNSTIGGSLNLTNYDAYSKYLVKYIQEMAKEGITIDAITTQNEPENPNNNPSLSMTADEQKNFIKNNLGPAFASAGIKTKILLFDHNCDHPNYPISILDDPTAINFIDGSAFHLYAGNISALSTVHNAHPDKNVYFTEQWMSSKGNFSDDFRWAVKNLIIGATQNWSKTVLQWNLANDPNDQPHTPGGCTECLGAITISDDFAALKRNAAYYTIGHASKFIRLGSLRIKSSSANNLPNVAFLTPNGKKVLIVLNDGSQNQSFNIKYKNKTASVTNLQAGGVVTYVWN